MKKTTQPTSSNSALNEKVAAVYEVRQGLPDLFSCSEFGLVDLSIITLESAKQLAEAGYLKEIAQKEQA